MRKTKDDPNIEQLPRRMAALEEGAYKEFFDLFGPEIRGYFIRHGLTPTDADELTASCLTDIALKTDRYHPVEGGGYASWVFTLARHALVDWLQRQPQ